MRLLHVEDSDPDALLISGLLRKAWPDIRIERAKNRREYEAALVRDEFDMILSDFALEDFDGLTALAMARERCPHIPYIFISGTIGEERAVEALKNGAADYVLKDRPTRLVPAVRQALALHEAAASQKESEQALRRSDEQIRERAILLDKARDAIIATDMAYVVTYWNPSAERLYGWTAAEVVGRPIDELRHHVDGARLEAARQRLTADGEWRGEFYKRTKSGALVLVETTWSLVTDAEGRPRSVFAIDTDVTEQRRHESQVLRAARLDSLGMLAGGVAHDLNNILAPVLMAAELLRTRLSQPQDVRLIDNIESSAQHGSALVRQLVAFAHGGEGERSRIDLAAFFEDVRVLLRASLPKNIKLSVEAAAPCGILGDPTQVKQVLLNLCINARDAMLHGGRIEIRAARVEVDEKLARLHPGSRPGPHERISVRDTGEGMPPEIVERIFDPFFTTKAEGKGSGLGLSMVSGIVKSHGGFVAVESAVGRGTLFELYFPALEG